MDDGAKEIQELPSKEIYELSGHATGELEGNAVSGVELPDKDSEGNARHEMS
jgi:hypothetical protein